MARTPQELAERTTRAAIYIRVSSEEQVREGYSLDAQEERLRAYVLSQGWTLAGVYRDEGFSGKNLSRAALQQMIADAKSGLFEAVLVWKLDRLSRRQLDVLHLIEDVFIPAKVGFRSATEAFDTTTPAGMAMVGMLAVFAQLERAQLIERVQLALGRRIDQRQWNGPAPYGYVIGKDGKLTPHPREAECVRRMFLEAVEGYGLRQIARRMTEGGAPAPVRSGRWYAGTIAKFLRNRTYLGEQPVRGEYLPNAHPALVSHAMFLQAQAAIEQRKTGARPRRGKSPYLLSGLLVCEECGRPMHAHRHRNRKRIFTYYYCDTARTTFQRCGAGYLRVEKLDELVTRMFLAGQFIREETTEESALSEAALSEVRARISRLVVAVEEGAVTVAEAKARLARLRSDAEALEVRIGASTRRAQTAQGMAMLGRLPELWTKASLAEKQAILRETVSRIEIPPSGIPRIYAFT